MAKIKCESCGAINNEDSKFCEKCGEPLNQNDTTTKPQEQKGSMVKCPFCGEKVSIDTEQCSYCGNWLNSSTTPKNYILIAILGGIGSLLGLFLGYSIPFFILFFYIGLIILIVSGALAIKQTKNIIKKGNKETKKGEKRKIKYAIISVILIIGIIFGGIYINDQFVKADYAKKWFLEGESMGFVGKTPEEINNNMENTLTPVLKNDIKSGISNRATKEKVKSGVIDNWRKLGESNFPLSGTGYYYYYTYVTLYYESGEQSNSSNFYRVTIDKNSGEGRAEFI